MRGAAFTLAEVLITLGIIGVVAALTVPSLIQHYKNHVVETRMAKFYSTFNQAIKMSEAENGDISNWYQDLPSFLSETDENGNPTSTGLRWFQEYIGKYMNISKVESDWKKCPLFYFSDGSALAFLNSGISSEYVWYTNYDKCIKNFGGITSVNRESVGKCAFIFIFNQKLGGAHKNKGLEPWYYAWDGTDEHLYSGCNDSGFYCAAIIERNGWKIPKNYPKRVMY